MKEIIGKNGIATSDIKTVDATGIRYRSYFVWKSMLTRCYSDAYHRIFPAYKGCVVDSTWLLYSNFKKWYDSTYPKNGIKYQLDKDILLQGNKVYSSTTCCWVPGNINKLLSYKKAKSSKTGITCYKNSFKIRVNDPIKNIRKVITTNTYSEAEEIYKLEKTKIIKAVADEALKSNIITLEVYNGLCGWVV